MVIVRTFIVSNFLTSVRLYLFTSNSTSFHPQILLKTLILWILPLALGQPFLRAYLLAEHGRCEHVDDMFRNTRTTLTHRVVNFLAWNMPYHAEHHAFPSVPFHRLPQLHQMTRNYLKVCENGYWRFNREYMANTQDARNTQSRTE